MRAGTVILIEGVTVIFAMRYWHIFWMHMRAGTLILSRLA
jgi:hypothetical protein